MLLNLSTGRLIAIGTLAACLTYAATGDGSNSAKAFVGGTIIDGTGKAPMRKATLVVRNGRVEAVGTSVKVPAGVEKIDVAGKTIIPGLISGHSHVSSAGQLNLYARYG